MLKRCLILSALLFSLSYAGMAQVEIYRGDPADTAKYIAPEDTITKAPMFGKDPDDIYRYIENRYNMTLAGRYLDYFENNVQFSFYVERNGRITDFKIIYTTNNFIGNEIEHIITNMPDWAPGKQLGRRKRTLMIYDINIQLSDNTPPVLVTKHGIRSEFSNRHKSLKWFLVAGSMLIMLTLFITKK